MSVKTEKDLPEFHRSTWLKAMSAMQLKNYGYTIQLLQTVLKSHPEFLAGRQIVRKASIAKNPGKKSLLGGLSLGSFSGPKIQGQIKKDPLAAIEAVEKFLENDPTSTQFNMMLHDAAIEAKLPEVAAFALETILDASPKDIKIMHQLARHCMQHGDAAKASDIYLKIIGIAPNDLAAVKGAKDAAAASSMQSGGWDKEETTYRDLIKDKGEAVALEQQSRVVRSEEMIDNLLADLHIKAEAEPSSVDTARRIAELYEQKEDWDNATNWFNYAAALTNNSDFALVRKASDLRVKQFDHAIEARRAIVASHPDTPEAEQYAAEMEDLLTQRSEIMLQSARARVEQNPTDLQSRFELGEILHSLHMYQEAIPELQRARQNPNVRIRAISLLGQCFTARSMLDLAAKTLSDAATELVAMDNVKKDIVYNLGLVYEKMNLTDNSIACMKQIYEVDYGYRDVAARVEGSY